MEKTKQTEKRSIKTLMTFKEFVSNKQKGKNDKKV